MRRIVTRALLAVTLASGVGLTSRSGTAAPAEDPESLIRQGVELRRQGKETRAEGYIRRAYQLAATPRTAAQLGLVELALKNYVDSDTHLSEALRTRDAWVIEHKQILEESRATARKHLLRVELTAAPKGTTYALEGADALALPADGVLWLAPAAASLQLEAVGHKPATIRVDGGAGDTRRVAVDMPTIVERPKAEAPKAVEPPLTVAATATTEASSQGESSTTLTQSTTTQAGAPAAPGRRLRIAGITVGAAGVVLGVVGGVLVSKALSKRDATRSAANGDGSVYDPGNGNWESLRTAGVTCLVGGAVAVMGGVGLYVFGRRAANEGGSTVSFMPGAGFGVLSLRRTF
jgi:hypothetical protein